MADQSKLIFVNTDGEFEESSSADSLQYGSFKTVNWELDDALLGLLVNAINVTTGAPDAAKFIKTAADGKIDASFLDNADIAHDSTSGVAASRAHDDYIFEDGTRPFSGDQSMGNFNLTNVADAVSDDEAPNYGQLKSLFQGLHTKKAVRVATTTSITLSGTQTIDGVGVVADDRVLVKDQGGGSPSADNGIYLCKAGAWVRSEDANELGELVSGTVVSVQEGTANADTRWMQITDAGVTPGTTPHEWDKWYVSDLVGGDGIDITGDTVSVDLLTAGGLKISSAQIAVEPADFAGTGLQDDGADNMEIDFANTGTEMGTSRAVAASDLSAYGVNQGAKILGGDPTNIAQSSSVTIQGILEDLGSAISETNAVVYTAGTGGVAKGDLVYVSANDTVLKLPVSGAASVNYGVGIAKDTIAQGNDVYVMANDTVITGVLTGATAGDKYYWNGSGYQTAIPTGSGNKVWQVGVAKNATDLAVEVKFIKKNS